MKQILIALGLIIVAAQTEGAQINENWEIGNSVFTLKTEQSYDDARVRTHKDICINFHKRDFLESGREKFYECSEDFFDGYANKFLDTCANEFKNGNASLLLFTRQNVILGGTYFRMEDGGKTVFIYSIGNRIDIPQEEEEFVQEKIITALSVPKNFPTAKRLVVFFKKDSQIIPLFTKLRFKLNEDYQSETLHSSFKDITLSPYEKAIRG